MKDLDLLFIDLETTGGSAVTDRITEIGLLIVKNGELVQEWSTLINPERPIPPYISDFTGITDDMVKAAPRFVDIHQELLEMLQGRLFVAHNARFDYGFIKNEFKRQNISFQAKQLCTAKLSRRLYPQHRRHNLDSIMERHGISCSARHRALGDAQVLWEFWKKLHQDHAEEELQGHMNILLKKPSTPLNMPPEQLENLPEGPGVYQFYGKDHELLYVGKSVNLRSRILSHFSGDHSAHREMRIAQLVYFIETVETAGELGALLKEAQLIKEKQPIFNRRLRRHRSLNSFRLHSNESGYLKGEIVGPESILPNQFHELYGVFRNKSIAQKTFQKIAEELRLCQKLLGLEKGTGECFAYQLNKCSGACVRQEPPDQYNDRLFAALESLRIGTWPFKGRIGVREKNPLEDHTEVHVFDNWCYLGSVKEEQDLYELLENPYELQFDLDTYKILKRWMRKNKHFEKQVLKLS